MYTPWHGEEDKWKGNYLTASEKSSGMTGYNPFEQFKGATKTDNAFHNISWEAVGVAVGNAMRATDSHVGYIASTKTRFTQKVKKSGGALKKKVTVTIRGFAKPQWFVATPIEVQPEGGISAFCVKDSGSSNTYGSTTTCDAPEHIATSGVSIMSWSGGNMPETEEELYTYVYKKSSFTVIAFAIITAIVTFGAATALIAAIGPAAVGFTATTAAAIGGGVYAGAMMMSGAGLTSAQAGWAGSTGNGVMRPNQGSLSKHNRGLNQAIENKQIYSRVGTGMSGVQTLYHGSCPENYSQAQCNAAGMDAGSMHRPDAYRQANTVIQLRDAEAKCIADGYTGVALAQCATPKNGAWTVDTGI